MIEADLYWQDHILVTVQVRGHAQASQRQLCAAVSCLLRSAAEAIANIEAAIDWNLKLPIEGEFSWNLEAWREGQTDVLRGISQVLGCGLRRLSEEFPQELTLCEIGHTKIR